jgi:hypothetical protein
MRCTLLGSTVVSLAAAGVLAACGSSPPAPTPIGPDGGTVALPGGGAVTIPAGALLATTGITVAEVAAKISGAISTAYRFGPEGTVFAVPVEVSFPVPAGTTAASVAWSRPRDESTFDTFEGVVANGRVSAKVMHFSVGFAAPACVVGSGCPTLCVPVEACAPADPCQTAGAVACDATFTVATCVATAAAPDGTPCAGTGTCLAGTCTARTVSGAFQSVYVDDGTQVTFAEPNLAGGAVTALVVPDASATTYTRIPVSPAVDGSFTVPAVPAGLYHVERQTTTVGSGGVTATGTTLTPFTSSSPLFRTVKGFRRDLARATGPTPVAFHFAGLEPWATVGPLHNDQDDLELTSSQADFRVQASFAVPLAQRLAAGATAWDVTLDWSTVGGGGLLGDLQPGLTDPAKGDVVWMVQRTGCSATAGTSSRSGPR